MVRKSQDTIGDSSPFAAQNYAASATESNMAYEASKQLPAIAEETQQWEEDGVNWSKASDGSLSYYDSASGSWIPYQG
jgi:hypothetical protein